MLNLAASFVMHLLHGGASRADETLFRVFDRSFSYSMFVWIAAFVLVNPVNYTINRIWTFDRSQRSTTSFLSFFAVGLCAALLGTWIKTWFTSPVSPLFLRVVPVGNGLLSREFIAHSLTILITMPLNFFFSKLFSFRSVTATVESADPHEFSHSLHPRD